MKKVSGRYFLMFLLFPFLITNCKEDFERPYKIYSSLLSQKGGDNPTEKILANELGITIEWTRVNVGIYQGILSKPVDLDKTTVIIEIQESNRIPTGGFIDSGTIEFHNCDRFNLYDSRDGLSNAVIEIKSFDLSLPD